MINYDVINILDMIDSAGEDTVNAASPNFRVQKTLKSKILSEKMR